MEREYTIFTIEETDFLVDIDKRELRERANPDNFIPLSDMRYTPVGYTFSYDRESRNVATIFDVDVIGVVMPPLIVLDPIGMAQKYGKTLDQLNGRTDDDITIDQDYLKMRAGGLLPIIDIAGHSFYVDVRMGSLRPHDVFGTQGILFSKIEDYLSPDGKNYLIPYDPKRFGFMELDFESITAFPKDSIAIEFPCLEKLDPYGYGRLHGCMEDCLRDNPLEIKMTARIVPWEETPLREIIAANLEKIKHAPEEIQKQEKEEKKQTRKQGRRM